MWGLRFAHVKGTVVGVEKSSGPNPRSPAMPNHGTEMDLMNSARAPYAPPRLTVYGSLEELTLTNSNDKNKNDALQGQNNLKT